MKLLSICSIAALLSAGGASAASALPLDVPPPAPAVQVTPVVNGYGPLPYGLYGKKRVHHGRSYGTGSRGRHSTRTGGPSGGNANRN